MKHKISGSIVIYKNDPSILDKAVESFLHSNDYSTLYLIDNSPTDFFRNRFSHARVKYTFNNKNIGFGAGHNIALKAAMAAGNDYHVILNPDVYFEGEVVNKIHAFMETDREIGLIMPKVLYPDGRLQPLCKLLPSPMTLFARRFALFSPSWKKRMNHWYEMHFTGYDKVMDVPFLSGCFMFLRLDSLKRVGLFDESIFLYTEDTDLTRRIHKHYRTVFFPDATVYHHHQRGSYKSVVIMARHVMSAIRYFNKWGWFYDLEREIINQRVLLKLLGD